MSHVDVDMSYNCKLEDEHFDVVSMCCGSPTIEIQGMCGGCNEFTGWECSVCEEDMSNEVYS